MEEKLPFLQQPSDLVLELTWPQPPSLTPQDEERGREADLYDVLAGGGELQACLFNEGKLRHRTKKRSRHLGESLLQGLCWG